MIRRGSFLAGTKHPIPVALSIGEPNQRYDVILTVASPYSLDDEERVADTLYQSSVANATIEAVEVSGNQIHLELVSPIEFSWSLWIDMMGGLLAGIAPFAIIGVLVAILASSLNPALATLLFGITIGAILYTKRDTWFSTWFR